MKIALFFLSIPIFTFAQVNFPTVPQTAQMPNYSNLNYSNPHIRNVAPSSPHQYFDNLDKHRQQKQRDQIMLEAEQSERMQTAISNQARQDINELHYYSQFHLPSHTNKKGTVYYRNAYEKMGTLNMDNYSIKDVNFEIENAYFENKQDKKEFDTAIQQSAAFILAKMQENNFDTNNNTAKNFMLFEFFSQSMQVKGFKEKHFPFKYDFNDYMGKEDWSKMFVTKLLKTGSGQCHSMPLLYLILAEAIGAEAYLSFSPNHSYIKFQDEKGKWYNLELTNGMLTVPSFILNNGFITAEALQNKIYMQPLSKRQVLSQLYTDLASGYIHKFGYDEFVAKVIDKALEIYPDNINTNMFKALCDTKRFQYAMRRLGINPENKQELQQIGNYPEAIALLNEVNQQYDRVDNLGYQQMPEEAYEKWLGSLQETKKKEESEALAKQFRGAIKFKN